MSNILVNAYTAVSNSLGYLGLMLAGWILVIVGLIRYRPFFVSENTVMFTEWLGKKNRQLLPGIHWCVPFFESVVVRQWTYVDDTDKDMNETIKEISRFPATEQRYDLPYMDFVSSDQVKVSIDAIAMYRIIHAENAVYSTDNPTLLLTNLVNTEMRQHFAAAKSTECFRTCSEICDQVRIGVNIKLVNFGLAISRLLVERIDVPQQIMDQSLEIITRERAAYAQNINAAEEHKLEMLQIKNAEIKSRATNESRLAEAKMKNEQLRVESEALGARQTAELQLKTKLLHDEHQATTLRQLADAKTAAESIRMAAESNAFRAQKEAEIRAADTKAMLAAGMSLETMVQLEQAKALAAINSSGNTVYMPSDLVMPTLLAGVGSFEPRARRRNRSPHSS